MPGDHRGNRVFTRVWTGLIDTVVCAIVLISISGIYLWAVIKAERKTGLIPPGRRMSVLCGDGVGHYFLTGDTSLGPYLERKFMPLFTMPKWIETWNRKIHIYLGLYFLFFLGLFSISGLVLNHPQWAFAQFRSSRIETSSVHTIKTPTAQENQARAEELLAQLNMEGEIEQIGTPPENRLNIQVVRPGRTVNISADFKTGRAMKGGIVI